MTMWTKQAPKEPGFYWFRYPQMDPIDRDDNPTIARVMKSRYSDRLTVAFPGNDECPQPDAFPDGEWWSERILPPGGEIAEEFVGAIREIFEPLQSVEEFNRAEAQRRSGLRTIAKPGEPGYKEKAE